MEDPGQTKSLCSWPLDKGHVPSPLIFKQSLSQGVAQFSQIFILLLFLAISVLAQLGYDLAGLWQ